jgi:bifunctional DNA-binding transcriptional regulator/antitoxin component of YhaV-PrlF toxin-antitoxin module
MSNVLVKLQRRGQMVIPRSLREQAELVEGTLMKVSFIGEHDFLVARNLRMTRYITTTRDKTRERAFRDLAKVVAEIRQEAQERGMDKMPMREIRAAVVSARNGGRKKNPVR